jgi:diphthamide biosynthesis protein 7
MHTLKNFEAGVTVISPHPRIDNVVACGSYDETVAIFDLRKVSNQEPKPLCHSKSMGGGLWRIKWHPSNDNQLLLGAMHGGCRVVQLNNENSDLQILQKFSSHQSMAYGADWLAFQDQTKKVEAVASCSFYDRALYLWEVQNNNSNFQ